MDSFQTHRPHLPPPDPSSSDPYHHRQIPIPSDGLRTSYPLELASYTHFQYPHYHRDGTICSYPSQLPQAVSNGGIPGLNICCNALRGILAPRWGDSHRSPTRVNWYRANLSLLHHTSQPLYRNTKRCRLRPRPYSSIEPLDPARIAYAPTPPLNWVLLRMGPCSQQKYHLAPPELKPSPQMHAHLESKPPFATRPVPMSSP